MPETSRTEIGIHGFWAHADDIIGCRAEVDRAILHLVLIAGTADPSAAC